jgi:hypothetical protein
MAAEPTVENSHRAMRSSWSYLQAFHLRQDQDRSFMSNVGTGAGIIHQGWLKAGTKLAMPIQLERTLLNVRDRTQIVSEGYLLADQRNSSYGYASHT